MFIKVVSQSIKPENRLINDDFKANYLIGKQIYVIKDESVFVQNKRYIQVFSYTLLPTTLVDNIYLLLRDEVNQIRPVLIRSSPILVVWFTEQDSYRTLILG